MRPYSSSRQDDDEESQQEKKEREEEESKTCVGELGLWSNVNTAMLCVLCFIYRVGDNEVCLLY